jgi:hypothetical protein
MKRSLFAVIPLALIVASIAVVGTGVADAGNSRHASVQPFSVVFTNGTRVLGTVPLKPGEGLDVRWKAGKCYGGFDSPPVVATWDGTQTGAYAPAMFAPCHVIKASARRNSLFGITWWSSWDSDGNFHCGWDWVNSSSLTAVANPLNATSASLNLAKGKVTTAVQMANGKLTTIKVQVPAGTNGVHWVGAAGSTG